MHSLFTACLQVKKLEDSLQEQDTTVQNSVRRVTELEEELRQVQVDNLIRGLDSLVVLSWCSESVADCLL